MNESTEMYIKISISKFKDINLYDVNDINIIIFIKLYDKKLK